MDRLALYIAMMSITCLAGALLVAFFVAGWYNWTAFAVAGLFGLVVGAPVAKLVSRRIKRNDPLFHPPHRRGGILPDPSAPEV